MLLIRFIIAPVSKYTNTFIATVVRVVTVFPNAEEFVPLYDALRPVLCSIMIVSICGIVDGISVLVAPTFSELACLSSGDLQATTAFGPICESTVE